MVPRNELMILQPLVDGKDLPFITSSWYHNHEKALNVKRIKTFVDLAQDFIQCQLSCFSRVVCLVDVFDRYDLELSMKSAERERRSASGLSRKVCQVLEGRPIPDWKIFLGVDTNKQAVLQFLGKSIVEHHDQSPRNMSAEDTLFLAGVCNADLWFSFHRTFCLYELHVTTF
jgi:hypothetical protein